MYSSIGTIWSLFGWEETIWLFDDFYFEFELLLIYGFLIYWWGTGFLVRKNVQYEEGAIMSLASKEIPVETGRLESW